MLLPLLLAPSCLRLVRDFVICNPGIGYNALLFRTFVTELKFAGLLSAGALASRLF